MRLGTTQLLATLALCAMTAVSIWKLLSLHQRLTSIEDNQKWEEHLRSVGAFRNGSILFFGDSEIAYWPMAESFGVLPIYSRGGKGDLAAESDNRFSRDLKATRPFLTVILIGTNDLGHGRTMEATLAHIEAMLRQVEGKAVVCSLLPASGDFQADHPAAEIERWNRALAALAASHRDTFVDLFSKLADSRSNFRSDLTVDGLHPSAMGYGLMTTELLPFVIKAISPR